jgi:hypothetical protein
MATYVAFGTALVMIILALLVGLGVLPPSKEVFALGAGVTGIGLGALAARAHRL